jgi:hypothetical protein
MALEDWRALTATRSCHEFAVAYPHPFLLSLSGLVASPPPPRTIRIEETTQVAEIRAERRRRITPADREPAVLPVRKSQPTFASMITVGRARNNDIVVPDALVSKVHAFFRCHDGQWGLVDAGSINGTRIGSTTLAPRAAPEPLHPGDEIAFGEQTFRFLDATTLWIAMR